MILEKEAFNKNNKLLRGKLKLSLKKTVDKNRIMERSIIRIGDVDNALKDWKYFKCGYGKK